MTSPPRWPWPATASTPPSARATPNLLRNSGETPRAPFKTGGCLDLMIGADARADANRAEPRSGRRAALGHPGPRQAAGPALPGGRAGHERSGPLLLALADDHHRPRGRRERPAPVRRQRRQLRAVDPAGRAWTSSRWQARFSRATSAFCAATALKRCTAFTGATRPPRITSDVPSEAQLTPRLWGRWIFESTR